MSILDSFQMSDYRHPPHHHNNESCRTLTLPRSIASHRDLLDKVTAPKCYLKFRAHGGGCWHRLLLLKLAKQNGGTIYWPILAANKA